jgi:hypothetical protein
MLIVSSSTKPTVLISPSLYTGLDLKDDLSRFQIIVKVPYPDLGDRWINEKRKSSEQWYTWQTALRLIQGYGRSIRSKEDYAVTYVLDSGFQNFVNRNRNILPEWFTQAIHPSLLKVPFGHAAFANSSKVHTTHNAVITNHYNPSIISEQTIKQNVNNTTEKNASTTSIKMPSDLAGLDSYIEDEIIRQKPIFICPYCQFSSTSEREYQRHIVLKHPGKSGYPNMSVIENTAYRL